VYQHGRAALAVLREQDQPNKDAERRDKQSARTGEDTLVWARPVKTFRRVGDIKNGVADL